MTNLPTLRRWPTETISRPESTSATPPSWSAEGDSLEDRPGEQHREHRLEREQHRGQRRRQARERDRDQQPADHLRAQRQQQQVALRGPAGRPVQVADHKPDRNGGEARDESRIEERAGGPALVAIARAEHEQEARVRDRGQDPERHAEARVAAVGAVLEGSRDEDDADKSNRDRRNRAVRRPLAQDRPGEQANENDLQVAEHRRETGADLLDPLVPGDQIDGEEHPGEPGQPALLQRPRPVAPVFELRQHPEQRHRIEAAKDRARRGRDVRDAEEDPRERDRNGADERGQDRPVVEPPGHFGQASDEPSPAAVLSR